MDIETAKRVACAAANRRVLRPDDVKLFVDIASSTWSDDPEFWHQLEWKVWNRVMRLVARRQRDWSQISDMARQLVRLSKNDDLERWFA